MLELTKRESGEPQRRWDWLRTLNQLVGMQFSENSLSLHPPALLSTPPRFVGSGYARYVLHSYSPSFSFSHRDSCALPSRGQHIFGGICTGVQWHRQHVIFSESLRKEMSDGTAMHCDCEHLVCGKALFLYFTAAELYSRHTPTPASSSC